MFENIANFFKKLMKSEKKEPGSRDAAKERLHLVLMQDRANVSADFLELMKQEIIEVIKKYIEVDEKEIDVRLTNKENEDGTNGAPALYANIPILNIRNEMKKEVMTDKKEEEPVEEQKEENVEVKAEEPTNVENQVQETPTETEHDDSNVDQNSETEKTEVEEVTENLEEVQENQNSTEQETEQQVVSENAQVVNETNNI